MAKDQLVTLTFDLTDGSSRDVEFTVPAGQDGANGTNGTDGATGVSGVGVSDVRVTVADVTGDT